MPDLRPRVQWERQTGVPVFLTQLDQREDERRDVTGAREQSGGGEEMTSDLSPRRGLSRPRNWDQAVLSEGTGQVRNPVAWQSSSVR